MRLLGQNQNYCYKCGQKLDWEFCPTHVTEEVRNEYQEYECQFFNGLITIGEMEVRQKNIMFQIYEEACNQRRKQQ